MKTKVQRLTDDSPTEMRLVEGGLLLKPSSLRPLSLDELLDGITESNRHDEVDTGAAQGLEAW